MRGILYFVYRNCINVLCVCPISFDLGLVSLQSYEVPGAQIFDSFLYYLDFIICKYYTYD